MSIEIVGDVDRNMLYCAGSYTKMLTSYVCLSLLAEHYDLPSILDDEHFFDQISVNSPSRSFLDIFQHLLGGKFTLHDICTYYAGLPYTFDVSDAEIERVDTGHLFKHHSILDEETFLSMCRHQITPVYPVRSKFHYSEISIIFLGYFIEKAFNTSMESLYQRFIIDKYQLKQSVFSRVMVKDVNYQDLSGRYDYPAIALQDHGYFCYSNGYYTTLNDSKILLEALLTEPVFECMTNLNHARAASNRLLNGLTLEIRLADGDVILGYEGLSFSGCNTWAYSRKRQIGYLTFTDNEEEPYQIIYDQLFGYTSFDKVPEKYDEIYKRFLKSYDFNIAEKDISVEYQGRYHRVKINDIDLDIVFTVGDRYIIIRNPDEIRYEVIYVNGNYRIKNKDNTHGSKVGFCTAKSGHHYFYFDGNLYKMIAGIEK